MENKRQDLNDIDNFNDMRLHVKHLESDLWDFMGSIRSFEGKLERKQKETENIKFKVKCLSFGFGLSNLLILTLFMKKK